MFDALSPQPADSLLALIKAFESDGRQGKIDLGVGVYRDAKGVTPVMKAVKEAERILLETQDSKRYLGPEGDMTYVSLLKPYIFGAGADFGGRLTGLQTPGGTGALRLGAELAHAANPSAEVWLGTPSWPNHAPIFKAAHVADPGLQVRRPRSAKSRFRQRAPRARRREGGRRRAAARLLPQSDRHGLLAG